MDCGNALVTCRKLWTLQQKLKELLSQYGQFLETIRINPQHSEARKSILSLVNEITDIGKHQNSLMQEWADDAIQLSEKYSSNKSILLANFKDALIRQLWSNGVEQCSEKIEEDAVKILFLNQMNLIPGNLDKCLNMTNDRASKTIDIVNLRVTSSVDGLGASSFGNGPEKLDNNNMLPDDEKEIEHPVEVEPRCTRSSKMVTKRINQDEEILTKSKLRRKVSSCTKTPNTCCSLCDRLIHINDTDMDEHGKLICCNPCNDKFYATVTVASNSGSNNDDPITPSDASSPHDTSPDNSHSNHS